MTTFTTSDSIFDPIRLADGANQTALLNFVNALNQDPYANAQVSAMNQPQPKGEKEDEAMERQGGHADRPSNAGGVHNSTTAGRKTCAGGVIASSISVGQDRDPNSREIVSTGCVGAITVFGRYQEEEILGRAGAVGLRTSQALHRPSRTTDAPTEQSFMPRIRIPPMSPFILDKAAAFPVFA